MRTNIEIDDDFIKRAMRASGAKTKREAVEAALRLMVQLKAQEKMRELRGKLHWEGDLKAMRRDRFAKE
jgi:Arc/MetJ family transcription regulator